MTSEVKVVLDTNVVVDHLLTRDRHSSNTLYHIKDRERHKIIVCEKLLREYRDNPALSGLPGVVDRLLMNALPVERMEKLPDPQIKIRFGPQEDRFHMQLAIDATAKYHVSKDGAVLACVTLMFDRGVLEVHPHKFVEECCRPRRQ